MNNVKPFESFTREYTVGGSLTYEMLNGEFDLKLSYPTTQSNNITCSSIMAVAQVNYIQHFLSNSLDTWNIAIINYAKTADIIKKDSKYSVGFADDYTTNGSQITGNLIFTQQK
jgi:hypothetical protein